METSHGEDRPGKDPRDCAGHLFVVATPIGNLEDITLRALKVLGAVDIIAAEDTRNTATLLARHAIHTRTVALHEHNEAQMVPKVLQWLGQGKSIALVSDAGTPAISDPGAHLVREVRDAGFPVTPIPGPNSATAGMSVAGLPDKPFLHYGFLPPRPAARRRALEALVRLPYALVFYESPHRILESVADLNACLGGERTVLIARELTKRFESVHCCRLEQAEEWLLADADRRRGEFVLIVGGAPERDAAQEDQTDEILRKLLAELPLAQAVKLTCSLSGAKRNDVYRSALAITASDSPDTPKCKH